MLIRNVIETVGNTPLLEISPAVTGLNNVRLLAKLELANPWGSVKDRTAHGLLGNHLDEIGRKGQTVLESSSGNTAKAMQMICNIANGILFYSVTNRVKEPAVLQILQLIGCRIKVVPARSECPDPTDPNNPLAEIERMMAAEPDRYFHASQYTSEDNPRIHYETTGPEIFKDAGQIDYFFAGVGTSGSSQGASRFLKEHNPDLKTIGIISTKGETLPGIRSRNEMFEVGLFNEGFYNHIVEVSIAEAIDGMLMLIRRLGVLSGPTGGAALAAALNYLRQIDATLTEQRSAVFIVCDRAESYTGFLKKHRPELFGLEPAKPTAKRVSPDRAALAKQVSVDEAAQRIANGDKLLVVDLRGPMAYKAGHIPGLTIFRSSETLDSESEFVVPFPDTYEVLFVCPDGDESRQFAAFFADRGLKCASLTGGMRAWLAAGKPLERGAKRLVK